MKEESIYVPVSKDFRGWNRTDARIQQWLTVAFPDRVTYAFPNRIYQRIYRRATVHEMTVENYLRVLGFEYDRETAREKYRHIRSKEELCNLIRRDYGDHAITNIYNKTYYPNLIWFVGRENKSPQQWMEENGFQYDDVDNIGAIWEEESLINELLRAFPTRIVEHPRDLWFWRSLDNAATRHGCTPDEYIVHLGFRLKRDVEDDLDEMRVKGLLFREFPDGVVCGLVKNPIYHDILRFARRFRCTVREVVESFGYEYQDQRIKRAVKTPEELEKEIRRWVGENDVKGLSQCPFYRDIRREGQRYNLTPQEYVERVLDTEKHENGCGPSQ